MGTVLGIAHDVVNRDVYVYSAKHVQYFSLANDEKVDHHHCQQQRGMGNLD